MKIILLAMIIINSIFAFDIKINISGIENTKGVLRVGLYDKNENFLKKEKVFKKVALSIKDNEVKYIFKNIHSGIYAIAIYHDINNNDKIDKSFFGIPIEGIGVSNNVLRSFGPPKYDEAKFELKDNVLLNIKMEY